MNGFGYVYETRIRFSDLDAMRHVNNATFIQYLESARLGWWLHATKRHEIGRASW